MSKNVFGSTNVMMQLFRLFLALAKINFLCHPLRDGDGEVHHPIQNGLSHVGLSIRRRRQKAQKKYLEKRRQRLATDTPYSTADTLELFDFSELYT